MKNILSLIACLFITIVLLQYRVVNSDLTTGHRPLKVTEWDAFGYYIYLPSFFIYHDYKKLDWLTDIDKKYAVTGGNGWQAQKADNGNYVFKYLGGVAILQAPFFFLGHFIAKHSAYPADGFSPPYQYALGFGIIFYCLLGLLLLRNVLLRHFKDSTVAITLLMLCLATNFIQYVAVDNGQSHAYIFPLYVLVIYTTLRWHRHPRILWAALTGYVIGLATISRPTEAIMLFIPLMWDTHTREAAKAKWQLVKQHKGHIIIAAIFGLIGVLPQLIYWKLSSGSFVYDVGSKWEFLDPHFRVLFGWEKGWFIYTPVTLFFIIGMFFIRPYPFRKSVLWFCLLNIWVIIAWDDWRYGGSYSTRALMQSYPVFALSFAAFTERINRWRGKWLFYMLCIYLLGVNLFQTWQYDTTILHYNDMNRRYYGRIYLNPHPTPEDMSLLDTHEFIYHEDNYNKRTIIAIDSQQHIQFTGNAADTILRTAIDNAATKELWLKITATIKVPNTLWGSYLNAALHSGDSTKQVHIRLFKPISERTNQYSFYMQVPSQFKHSDLQLYISSPYNFEGTMEKMKVEELKKK